MALEIQTFDGVPGGAAPGVPAHAIEPGFARYIQDALLDEPETTRQRGPVRRASFVVDPVSSGSTHRAFGLFGTFRPDGVYKMAALYGDDAATTLAFLTDGRNFIDGTVALPHIYPNSGAYPIVDAKPAQGGGLLIGVSDKYGNNATKRVLAHWRGAGKAAYSTGTISVTVNTTAVTGVGTSWLANVEPGMFLLNDAGAGLHNYVGVVKTVNSDTSITLETGSAVTFGPGASYDLLSVRALVSSHSEGRITVASGATTVNGGGTRFKDHALGSGWALYRARDMKWLGNIVSVASNTQMTISASTDGMVNEDYVALFSGAHPSWDDLTANSLFGFLNATWQGTQFYANRLGIDNGVQLTRRITYADPSAIEAIDQAPNGTFFDIPSSYSTAPGLVAILGTQNALLALDEFEAYGIFGNDPDNWTARKIADDGALSTMSVMPHKGGAIWAGKKGIYHYDGVTARNLTEETLGQWYEAALQTFNPESSRMWAMIERDHYFVFVQAVTPTFGPKRGTNQTIPTRMTISVNLKTGAVTFLTNVNLRGAATTPASAGVGTLYVVESMDGLSREILIADARGLFADGGLDEFASRGDEAGPQFYLEPGKFDAGDGQLKKLFKQLQLHFSTDGDVHLDVVPGLEETGTTSASRFRANATYQNKRIKFLKRSQHLGLRIYGMPMIDGNDNDPGAGSTPLVTQNQTVVSQETLRAGTVVTVSFEAAGGSLSPIRAVMYSDSGGQPDVLLAQSAGVSILSAGVYHFPLLTPTAVTAGTYWIGVQGDTATNPVLASTSPTAPQKIVTSADLYGDGVNGVWGGTTSTTLDKHLRVYVTHTQPSRLRLGPWAIGFKRQRLGKV